MEFENLQVIWKTLDDQPMYAIDQPSMRKLVGRKERRIRRAADRLEWSMIAVALVASVVLPIDAWREGGGIHPYVVAAACAVFAILAFVIRIRRIEPPVPFDESIKAIAERSLAQVGRQMQSLTWGFWGLHVPIAVIAAAGLTLETNLGSRVMGALAIWGGVSLVTAISYAAFRGEMRKKSAEREELEALVSKLESATGR